MATVPLVTLEAPKLAYLSKTQLAKWLQVQRWEIDVYVSQTIGFLAGQSRPGREGEWWSQRDAAHNKYVLDHLDRMPGAREKVDLALEEARDQLSAARKQKRKQRRTPG